MSRNTKTALIIGGVILGLLFVVPWLWGSLAGTQDGGWGMMGSGMMAPGMMGGGGWGWFGPIFMVVFWVLIVWAVVALVQGASQPSGSSSGHPDSALEVLKKRYARGEINRDDYEEMRRTMT